LVGCETADYLSEKGEKVILVEILPEIATGSDADTKTYFSLKFQKNGVKVYTDTEFRRVDRKTAILQKGNEEIKIQVETVVFAVGAEPNDGLYNELISSGSSVIKVGDCVKPRTLLEAVQEGFKAGRSI
jgi:2-enoate reductase